MLSYEVPRTRMQAPRKERAHEQVDIGDDPEVLDDDVVREEDDGEVRGVPLSEGLRAHEAGAESIEEDLEGSADAEMSDMMQKGDDAAYAREEGLPEDVVEAE